MFSQNAAAPDNINVMTGLLALIIHDAMIKTSINELIEGDDQRGFFFDWKYEKD